MTVEQRKQLVTEKIQQSLQPHIFKLTDESHLHVGHPGAAGGASHFAIEIQAKALENLSRLKQHQAIYQCLGDLIPKEIHALRIKVLT